MASRSSESEQLTLPLVSWRTMKVWQFLTRYVEEHGYCPSFKEIGAAAELRSTSAVSYQLRKLEELGYIERYRWAPRKIRILEKPTWQSGPSSEKPEPT